jgi:hypothetical protein
MLNTYQLSVFRIFCTVYNDERNLKTVNNNDNKD